MGTGPINDFNAMYYNFEQEDKPENINLGPFQVFAMIDGHRGIQVAKFIKKYLMEAIYRNECIMKKRWFAIGLKQVFLKLEEILTNHYGTDEINYLIGRPGSKQANIFMPHSNHKIADQETDPCWECGAALTVMIITSDEIITANVGDCRAVMNSARGSGKYATSYAELTKDHKVSKGVLQEEKQRVTKHGYIMTNGKIISSATTPKNSPNEVIHGGPLTRCIGDLRFK